MEFIKEVDTRGLACPQSVLHTKQALDTITSGVVVAIVDNEEAKEKIVNFAKCHDCTVELQQQAGVYHIEIHKGIASYVELDGTKPLGLDRDCDTVIVIKSDTIGSGPAELGSILMKSYLYTLGTSEQQPTAVILLNSAVKLAADGAQTVESLRALQNKGVEILACGTCLEYFQLQELLAVGSVTNMYIIAEWMRACGKVITL